MSAPIVRYDNPAAAPLDVLLSLIPSLPRHALDRLTQEMIDRLDALDGDCDLEDDDPAGDTLDELGEHPTDNGTPMLPLLPVYGDDQTPGPLNEREAYEAWQRGPHH